MKISVIIPAFNAESHIEKAINSILVQKGDYEVFIVDDNSQDNTLGICNKIKGNNPSIKIYSNNKKGVSSARNLGLKEADGDIICFCDADDYFEPNAFSIVNDCFCNNEIDVLISAFFVDSSNVKTFRGYKKTERTLGKDLIPRVINDQRITGSPWAKFFKREIVKDITFNEELSYAEDLDFVVNSLVANEGCKCLIINEALYNYVDNPNSVVNNTSKLFDENDHLKYISAFKSIRNSNITNKTILEEIGYKIVWYAIDIIIAENPTGNKRTILRKEIKENIKYLFTLYTKYGVITNTKKLLYIIYEFIFVRN